MSRDEEDSSRELSPSSLGAASVNALLEPWLAGRMVESVELMPGGLTNRNFHLRLHGRPSEAVLRLYDRDPAACAREVAVLGLVGRDLPVPRVLYAADDAAQPHAVLSVVEGISLHTLRSLLDPDAVAEAAFDTGRILARLSDHPGPPTPAASIAVLADRFASAPAFAERAGAATGVALVELAARWQPRLDEAAGEPGLVHGDFNSRNVFVRRTEAGWRVSGILDWESALSSSTYRDIGSFLRYHSAERPRFEPHFSAGLREGGMRLPGDWLWIARLMDLPALMAMLGRPDLPDPLAAELLALLQATIAGE